MMLPMTRQAALHYLAALVDGEGSITDSGPPLGTRSISIVNTEKSIIKKAVECLDTLGIDCSVLLARNTQSEWFVLEIGGQDNLQMLARVLPLGSHKKLRQLQDLATGYKRKKAIKRKGRQARPPDWEELENVA